MYNATYVYVFVFHQDDQHVCWCIAPLSNKLIAEADLGKSTFDIDLILNNLVHITNRSKFHLGIGNPSHTT